jgi:ElaB/YqjD/DUF883 family membrane-anchored ribosome-binding protein
MGCSGSRALPPDDEFEKHRVIVQKDIRETEKSIKEAEPKIDKMDPNMVFNDPIGFGKIIEDVGEKMKKLHEDFNKLEEVLKTHKADKSQEKIIGRKEKIFNDTKDHIEKMVKCFGEKLLKKMGDNEKFKGMKPEDFFKNFK